MNNFIKWIVTRIAAFLSEISSTDLTTAIDLVVKAQGLFTTGAEKLKWFAEEFSKINSSIKLWHTDGNPTNTLNLLVSLAKSIAKQFDLLKSK